MLGLQMYEGCKRERRKLANLTTHTENTKKVLLIPVKGWPKSSLGV
jgi:hypothetical protein